MDCKSKSRVLVVVVGVAALLAPLLTGCGSGIAPPTKGDATASAEKDVARTNQSGNPGLLKPKQKARYDATSGATPLLKPELQSILPFSRFAPQDRQSLAYSLSFEGALLFEGEDKILYVSQGAGIRYEIRHFEINDSGVCVYDDEDHQILFQCIQFFKISTDLFRLRFKDSSGTILEVIYVRYPNYQS